MTGPGADAEAAGRGARIVLINGAPGSGKSTLARRLCAEHRLALCLDIDVVRGMLGSWLDDPGTAGMAARRLALAMIEAHVASGRDVVIAQFLARPDFIDTLVGVAAAAGARFDEVVLVSSADEAASRFAQRSANPADHTHSDAAALQARAGAEDVTVLYERLMAMVAERPQTIRVESHPGDVEGTLDDLRTSISWRA